MKKLFLLFVPLAMLMCSACGSDDNEESAPSSLQGKTFAAFNYSASNPFGGGTYDVYKVFRFVSASEVEVSSRENSPTGGYIGDIEKCQYTYKYPKLMVKTSYNTYDCEFLDAKTFRCYWYSFGSSTPEPHDFYLQ